MENLQDTFNGEPTEDRSEGDSPSTGDEKTLQPRYSEMTRELDEEVKKKKSKVDDLKKEIEAIEAKVRRHGKSKK